MTSENDLIKKFTDIMQGINFGGHNMFNDWSNEYNTSFNDAGQQLTAMVLYTVRQFRLVREPELWLGFYEIVLEALPYVDLTAIDSENLRMKGSTLTHYALDSQFNDYELLDKILNVSNEPGRLIYDIKNQLGTNVYKQAIHGIRDYIKMEILFKYSSPTGRITHDNIQFSPLHYLITIGNENDLKESLKIMELLIKQGEDTNYVYNRLTPLCKAIMQNNYDAVKLLLDKGADPFLNSEGLENKHAIDILLSPERKDKEMFNMLRVFSEHFFNNSNKENLSAYRLITDRILEIAKDINPQSNIFFSFKAAYLYDENQQYNFLYKYLYASFIKPIIFHNESRSEAIFSDMQQNGYDLHKRALIEFYLTYEQDIANSTESELKNILDNFTRQFNKILSDSIVIQNNDLNKITEAVLKPSKYSIDKKEIDNYPIYLGWNNNWMLHTNEFTSSASSTFQSAIVYDLYSYYQEIISDSKQSKGSYVLKGLLFTGQFALLGLQCYTLGTASVILMCGGGIVTTIMTEWLLKKYLGFTEDNVKIVSFGLAGLFFQQEKSKATIFLVKYLGGIAGKYLSVKISKGIWCCYADVLKNKQIKKIDDMLENLSKKIKTTEDSTANNSTSIKEIKFDLNIIKTTSYNDLKNTEKLLTELMSRFDNYSVETTAHFDLITELSKTLGEDAIIITELE